jgi:hypothetical protein
MPAAIGGLAGGVLAGAGGQDLAEDDLVHLLGLHAGAAHRRLQRDGAERCARAARRRLR